VEGRIEETFRGGRRHVIFPSRCQRGSAMSGRFPSEYKHAKLETANCGMRGEEDMFETVSSNSREYYYKVYEQSKR
jgi:hypothetical protein